MYEVWSRKLWSSGKALLLLVTIVPSIVTTVLQQCYNTYPNDLLHLPIFVIWRCQVLQNLQCHCDVSEGTNSDSTQQCYSTQSKHFDINCDANMSRVVGEPVLKLNTGILKCQVKNLNISETRVQVWYTSKDPSKHLCVHLLCMYLPFISELGGTVDDN